MLTAAFGSLHPVATEHKITDARFQQPADAVHAADVGRFRNKSDEEMRLCRGKIDKFCAAMAPAVFTDRYRLPTLQPFTWKPKAASDEPRLTLRD